MCVNLFHGQPPWRKNPVQRALGRQAKPHQPFSLYVFRWTMSEEVGESNHASWTMGAVSTWRRAIPSRMPKISVPVRVSVSQSCPSGHTARPLLDRLIDWLIDHLKDRVIARLIDRLLEWFIDGLIPWLCRRWIDCLTDYLSDRSMDWLIDRWINSSIHWSMHRVIDRLIHWLIGWPITYLFDRKLIDWSIDWLIDSWIEWVIHCLIDWFID